MEECVYCNTRGDETTLRRCSRCKTMRYCSRDCQARHWPEHRITCTPTDDPVFPESEVMSGTDACFEESEASLPRHNTPDPWQRVRSRALAAFPGNRIVDSFDDLDSEFGMFVGIDPEPEVSPKAVTQPYHKAKSGGTAIILKLVAPIFNPKRRGWAAQDKKGSNAHIYFDTQGSPTPHFRFDDLQRGHFLCVKEPPAVEMHREAKMNFFDVKDITTVRVYHQ